MLSMHGACHAHLLNTPATVLRQLLQAKDWHPLTLSQLLDVQDTLAILEAEG